RWHVTGRRRIWVIERLGISKVGCASVLDWSVFDESRRAVNFVKRRLMKTLVIFVSAMLFPVLAYRPHRPSVDQASSADETYEVFSAVMKELFLNKFQVVKGGGADSGLGQLVVIRDRTTLYGTPGSDSVSAWRTGRISIDDETIEDFRRNSSDVSSLEPR